VIFEPIVKLRCHDDLLIIRHLHLRGLVIVQLE
jgi:hypothetical protein